MRRMLTSRISRRVLAEHHISLSENYRQQSQQHATGERHVGIIYTGLNVTQSIQKCISILKERSRQTGNPETPWPEVIVNGHLDTKFSYIREHLECAACITRSYSIADHFNCRYIIFELIKNASDNTSKSVNHLLTASQAMWATAVKYRGSPLPPILATVVAGTDDVGIRISDQGE